MLKVKYRADGSYDRHKGRLVVKGFQAYPASPLLLDVLTHADHVLRFCLSRRYGLDVVHVGIPLIQSKIDVPIYVQLPSGITVDARYQDGKYNNVVRLLRYLYGLHSHR